MTKRVMAVLLGVMGACGGDDDAAGRLADGQLPRDAREPSPVTAHVTVNQLPSEGQVVYFQNADSTFVATQMTDAEGNARAVVSPGSFVTVIEPRVASNADFTGVSTFADVQPGDVLNVDTKDYASPSPTHSDVSVTVRVPNEQQGYYYQLSATCALDTELGRGTAGGGAQVAHAVTFSDCGGVADILVVGVDLKQTVHSWAYVPNAQIATGAVIEVATMQPAVARTFSYTTELDATVAVQRSFETARGEIYRYRTTVAAQGTTGTVTVPTIALPGVKAITKSEQSPGAFAVQQVNDWGDDTDYAIDLPSASLHRLASAPQFDIASHTLTWTEAATSATPDWIAGAYFNARSEADGEHSWRWRITAPHANGMLRYPVLPTTGYDFNPRPDDPVHSLSILAVRGGDGYADAKANVFTTDNMYYADANPAGSTGRLLIETHNDIDFPALRAARRR